MKARRKAKLSNVEKLERQISYLGGSTHIRATTFLAVRWVSTILLVFCLYYLTNISYFIIPFLAIGYYYLLYYVMILLPIERRRERLEREALNFFEILTLSLESGRNLETSIEITVDHVSSELSLEFERTLKEVKYGKSMPEALKDMKKRIPSEAINNVLLSITEASLFGSSLLENMYNQMEFLREKRILSIRERINQIPNKISIVSVLFMVPLMLLLVLGPLLIRYIG